MRLFVSGRYNLRRDLISHTLLFWVGFILTRPLGATLGDLLDKPHDLGGFALGRYYASAILAAIIIAGLLILPQKAGSHPRAQSKARDGRPRRPWSGLHQRSVAREEER